MSEKKYISSERHDANALTEEEASAIHPRPAGPHHKPGHKPDESVKPRFLGESQDADRHNKTRHEDSQK